ncbi:hypothetical protein [Streptomyces sp. FH025]|uniref:hypothetical protein n=1 Tax=Streptomyces sp. FH025 TaxID=2815937 RepID=UPI001A9EFD72|nr:hypothetical protein [Streptomyces sp. FH025]MBO1417412.1 hypothetical protein [Streptomyces sp. FH025]
MDGLSPPLNTPSGYFVKQAHLLQQQAEELMQRAVYAERSRGTSWEDIGKQLGVTRSTVHGRYAAGFNDWVERAGRRDSLIEAVTSLRLIWAHVEERSSFQISRIFPKPSAETRRGRRRAQPADDGPLSDHRPHFVADSDHQTGALHGGHHGELRFADDTSELPVDERLRRLESAVAFLLRTAPNSER